MTPHSTAEGATRIVRRSAGMAGAGTVPPANPGRPAATCGEYLCSGRCIPSRGARVVGRKREGLLPCEGHCQGYSHDGGHGGRKPGLLHSKCATAAK